jgi:arabinose-5-phosphate isomerase
LKPNDKIKEVAVSTIETELKAAANLVNSINDDFLKAVDLIIRSKGRVVITGIGKSALVAQKIVATLNSTGTPSIFMHAADAIHGDLGIIKKEDIIICLSKSGETPEIRVLVPLLKQRGNRLIALVGNTDSFLARSADYVLDATVPAEACPNNLAPTSSTTAQIILGDALAVALLESRGFTSQDFAKLHPGGTLGKKLYMRVKDLYIHNEAPMVLTGDRIGDVIIEISAKRLGAAAVLDNDRLVGIITDGDLRRMLQKYSSIDHIRAEDIMTQSPKTTSPETLVVDALNLMRSNNITQLLVIKNERYAGMIHLHDILKEGIL